MTSSLLSAHELTVKIYRVVVAIAVVTAFAFNWRSDAATDSFSALVDVERAVKDEAKAADVLRKYVSEERQRLDRLEELADKWEHHSKTVLETIRRHVYHPVNYFLLVKYYAINFWTTLSSYVASTDDVVSRLHAQTENFPGHDAFASSAIALLRLQDVYKLSTDNISNGRIGDGFSSLLMTAEDCFQLGKYAFESRDFYHAVLWLNESLRVVDTETTKTVPKPVILEYLSASMFQRGNLHHAYNLTLSWLQLEPGNSLAMDNALALRDMIINEERPMPALDISHVVDDKPIVNDRPLNSEQSAPAYGAYERLCRGEEVKDDELVCTLRRHVPMLYLNPLKEELISLEPRVVFFHDVLTEMEMEKLEELAVPKLHPSVVFASKDSNVEVTTDDDIITSFANERTSKSAWLNDAEDVLLGRISRKAASLSNLTLDTAEDFQVLNYGTGGHYEPHVDYVTNESISQFNDQQGNRVATVICYLNDVDEGGYTVFNEHGLYVPPEKGSCMLWYNLLRSGAGDTRTVHASCPVLVGTKWVANKWFHYCGQEFTRPCGLNPAD